MTDTPTTPPVAPSGPAHAPAAGAGQLLRQYRDAAGLHIVSLAAALKVSRAKIEALETERYDELPDVAFARALAMSCCRYLGKEVEPVLALMPSHAAQPTPGLRPQVPVQSENLSRPRFQQSRGPFNHATVPPWVIWALVIAVIVVGGWFAASPQRAVVKAPASALDIPPQGLPGAAAAVRIEPVNSAKP
jgi:cytoskeleton protein RodZ